MIHETYSMKVEGSMAYARLVTYLQEDTPDIMIHQRPMVVVCPGGAYYETSDREADVVALRMLGMGFHAAVLRYSCAPAVFPAALLELASSVKLLREHAAEWHIDPEKIVVMGFSAGGHLAASLGVFWNKGFLSEGLGLKSCEHQLLRPDGMILCYPVITSGEYANRGSFENLLGLVQDRVPELFEGFGESCPLEVMLEKLSLEKQVSRDTPRAFIWHTFEDGLVPVENSLLLAGALRKAGVETEFHMYPHGVHGLSLASRLTVKNGDAGLIQEACQGWVEMAGRWIWEL